MRTSPRSGTRSPFVVLSRTLLPVPDGPTIDSVSRVWTFRSTTVSTGRSNALWMSMYSITSVQEKRGEHGVEHQHRDDHHHDRAGGGAADAFGAAARLEAHVHADQRDDEAEDDPLGDRVEQVPAVPEEPRAVEERLGPEPDREARGDQAGEDADEVGEADEQGHGDEPRDHPWRRQHR